MVQTGNWRHVRLPSFGLQAGNNRSVISCIPADPNSFASLLQTNFVSSAVDVSNVASTSMFRTALKVSLAFSNLVRMP